MKKNLSVLMFVIATILFISCEKDLYENAIKNEKRKATVSTVNLNDLSKSKGLYEKFITTKNRLSSVDSKLVYNSDFGFYIDTENMKLIAYNDYKTLTAQIYRSGYLGKFENLYIHQYPNGSFGAFIFDYNFSEQDIDKYILNQPIENLIDKTRFKAIDYANTVDYNGTVIPYNGACYTINNVFEDDEDGQVWVTLILCPGCECGSSDDVQIIPNDDSYGATFNYYYFNLPGMPDQYPGSGTPSGGGNSSTGSNGNPIITQPLINENKNEIKLINDYLNDDQDNWWYFTATPETKVDILDYLSQNYTDEAFLFALQAIEEIKSNTISPDLLANDVIIIGEDNNSNIITNLQDYLSCFNLNQGAVFTIYVDQPTAGSNKPWSGNPLSPDVGHTFFSIKQGDNRRVLGFYPANSVSLDNPSTTGSYHNNGGSEYDVALSFFINSTKLNSLLTYINSHTSTNYNINSNNCTDFGMSACKSAGVKLISAYGTWGITGVGSGAGDNPGQLGQNIRNMPVPVGFVKTTTSGLAPVNSGN